MNDTRLKHLELINNVIDRLSHKSFLVKSWSITAVTAILAFGIDKEDFRIFIVGVPVACVFWYLDTQYLWLENVFRELYKSVLKKEIKPMDMDISGHKCKVNWWVIFRRPTIWVVYFFEILILILSIIYFTIYR